MKKIIIFLVVAFAVVAGITLLTNNSSSSENVSTESYSLSQVATHNNASSCWTAIRSQVYDMTAWIDQHPGGRQAILSLCGKDGTAAFVAQHGGEAQPEAELKSFFIGNYKK